MDVARLAEILTNLPSLSYQGTLYRMANFETLQIYRTPLYAKYGKRFGLRYTPVGGMETLYLAADPETAFAEVQQDFHKLRSARELAFSQLDEETQRHQRSPRLPNFPPSVLYSVEVELDTILDLIDPEIQRQLGTTQEELCQEWLLTQFEDLPVPTQTLGKATFDCGRFQAMRYPSARLEGHDCYVVFPERLTRKQITLFNSECPANGCLTGSLLA